MSAKTAGASWVSSLLTEVGQSYSKTTPKLVKLIDAYCLFCALVAGTQFAFVFLVGTFPFNTFLSGLVCAVGSFAFAASLRMQLLAPEEFDGCSPKAAFREFLFCHLLLFLAVFNYIG